VAGEIGIPGKLKCGWRNRYTMHMHDCVFVRVKTVMSIVKLLRNVSLV